MNLFTQSKPSCRQAGWTLVEIMIAVGISSIVMGAIMQTSMFTSRSFVALGNYDELDRASRNALDNMTREIRQAKVFSPQYYRTNMMIFTNLNNSYFGYEWEPHSKNVYHMTGDYNAANNSFVNVQRKVILTGCDYFSFRIW